VTRAPSKAGAAYQKKRGKRVDNHRKSKKKIKENGFERNTRGIGKRKEGGGATLITAATRSRMGLSLERRLTPYTDARERKRVRRHKKNKRVEREKAYV